MPKCSTDVVFVYLGPLPEYARYSLLINAKIHSSIVLLTDSETQAPANNIIVINIRKFYSRRTFRHKADDSAASFRDGFWLKTLERFFVLLAYMNEYKVRDLFHAEIDNIVFDFGGLAGRLDAIGVGLFYPVLNRKFAGASIIYINSTEELSHFCKFVNDQQVFKNDMIQLAEYAQLSRNVYPLPAENLMNNTVSSLPEIFDVACIGQFLFGIDPRNTSWPVYNMFVNVECNSDLRKMQFELGVDARSMCVNFDGCRFKLMNLHVHSKVLKKIYEDDRFLKNVLRRINRGKSTLIALNLGNLPFVRTLLRFFTALLKVSPSDQKSK